MLVLAPGDTRARLAAECRAEGKGPDLERALRDTVALSGSLSLVPQEEKDKWTQFPITPPAPSLDVVHSSPDAAQFQEMMLAFAERRKAAEAVKAERTQDLTAAQAVNQAALTALQEASQELREAEQQLRKPSLAATLGKKREGGRKAAAEREARLRAQLQHRDELKVAVKQAMGAVMQSMQVLQRVKASHQEACMALIEIRSKMTQTRQRGIRPSQTTAAR